MNGRVAKALRKIADGDKKKYKTLKRIYKKVKLNLSSKELPF